MPPQTPTPPPAPSTTGYEFLNPAPPRRPSPIKFLKNGSFKTRLIVIVGGALILIILIIIIASLFSGTSDKTTLIGLAQQQNELITISTQADNTAVQQTTKNLAINTELALTSDQLLITSYLAQHGTKVSSKQLASGQSSTVTQQLSQAQAASNYDPVYIQIMQSQLASYRQSLKAAFATATNANERQMINNEYVNAGLLLGQSNTASKDLSS